ncbi:StfH/YfcO family fimbrial adhesin [Escherichia albertii]|uniref:StfH/YfcO family fimbrial adhesin n=1 Tax=Escherichia albertii TaxID=208962 RepID=UPI00237A15E5|nr:StfH/YfcO family fimbrial adhesin [Escherichia albertii]MDD9748872.1 StfH/YfcO family fimbrial adhesin [Escherichia albertii]
MKKLRLLFCLLMAIVQVVSLSAKAQSFNLNIYIGEHGAFTQVEFLLDVITIDGVYHGDYYQNGKKLLIGSVPNHGWTGPDTASLSAPTLEVTGGSRDTNSSNCPGLTSGWGCDTLPIKFTINGTAKGCPWLVTLRVYSTGTTSGAGTYLGPWTKLSTCPAEPVAPYDVSWDENYVARNKTVRLSGGSGVVTQTLSTYLMKDGQLCDSSKSGERGAYCRIVSQLMTFTASGCDDARVSATPTPHPIGDKQLHDMVLQVNTSNNVPAIAATCRFQYILNEL